MASLRRLPSSPYWIAVYRDLEGRQCNRSTKITVAGEGPDPKARGRDAAAKRSAALAVAQQFEITARGHATEAQVRRVLKDLFNRVNPQRMDFARTEDFLRRWLESMQRLRKARTHERYAYVIEAFLKSLGPRARAPIGDLTVQDIQPFIEADLKTGKSPGTVRMTAKILNAPFAHAMRIGEIITNPVAAVHLPDATGETREPLEWGQVTALLREAQGDWKTAIMLGAFTGARLGDCVSMKWANVDLPAKILRFRPEKTSRKGRDLIVPLHPTLEAHLMTLPMPNGADAAQAPLCPKLAAEKIGGRRGLSRQFQELMTSAGIENGSVRKATGAGRSLSRYGFHSLRHTFNTMLLNKGVPEDVRMRLSGHATEDMNRRYSHAELVTLRQAISTIPQT